MIHSLFRILSSIHLFTCKGYDRILMFLYKHQFSSCGRKVHFYPTSSYFYYPTISIGNNVYIGPGATFLALDCSVSIGDKVMFGPNVSIIAGNHSTHIPGKCMADYRLRDKRPEDDLPVVIEEDVWIASGACILNGVRVHRGAIVAAGAVVTKDVPPYAVVGGVPARVLKYRWSPEEIRGHELLAYAEEERLSGDVLEKCRM